MRRKGKARRQSHGSAWHWKQTDCWYYTLPGTKRRIALFDDQGQRIRGTNNREAADLALSKEKLAWEQDGELSSGSNGEWLVARVCSDYIQYCERGLAKGSISKTHRNNTLSWLNDLCAYCGAMHVAELKKGHISDWLESHTGWRSTETHRSVISVVLAAFNRAEEMFGIVSPLKGLKKPKPKPRLQSINPVDEEILYASTDIPFRDFLVAAIQTGLRPFCELATITAEMIEESNRGMMWRVYSSKTKKTRKIPIRPEVAELVRKLIKSAPKGSGVPLFRNSKGKPWKCTTGVMRFLTLKKKLGWNIDPVRGKYSCYTCRHTFAHRMLSGYWTNGVGCTIETLAELMGDTPKVAFEHYGKEWGQHYQDPLWAAIGEGRESKIQKPKPNSNQKRSNREVDNRQSQSRRRQKSRSTPSVRAR